MKIGIDLGGSKTELIALDGQGIERLRFREPTPAGDYAATVQLIANMVGKARTEVGAISTIGVGTPGAVSTSTGLMKNCNSTCLNGQALKEDVEQALGREIRMSNDASCFALSEAMDGAAAGFPVVFGVILGTGVGGGLVVNGTVLDGANHIAGEWGHNSLPLADMDEWPGADCYCGRRGCIETWLSGPAMRADHYRHTGNDWAAERIAAEAESGQADCLQAVYRYCDRLARALAGVINIVDPDAIVLGGGISNIPALYEQVPELWGQYVFSDVITTKLLPPAFGDSSGVRGAARLWEG